MLKGWPQTLTREGNEAIMLRTIRSQPSLWEAIRGEGPDEVCAEVVAADLGKDAPTLSGGLGLRARRIEDDDDIDVLNR